MTNEADTIRDRAKAVVKGVLNDEVGAWRWIKRLVATTTKEYRGRFLYELIQNGFDAHPAEARSGRIAVHFYEDEGSHGVLYVANGGKPLSKSNFERMASLGDSDKEIGIGIGNKGVGFKSVFQICKVPEVYSAANPIDTGFGGFTFRFGKEGDLEEFQLGADEARKVRDYLSYTLLTVPLVTVPRRAEELRKAGYVTVIRLPASNKRAAEVIQERIQLMLGSRSPIMMFLDRLESLSLQASILSGPTVLTRREEPDDIFTRVVLNEHERFRVFTAEVPNAEVRAALEDSVDEGALDESWLTWKEDATISVAVGEPSIIGDPASFTFLPMSDKSESPLAAHINAPFVTDFPRLSIDSGQPVNRLMMRKIAELCVRAAQSLIATESQANTVVDLLAWQSDKELLDEAVSSLCGTSLMEFFRVPVIGRSEWATLEETSLWPDLGSRVLTGQRVSGICKAMLVDRAAVDCDRLERLERCGFDLSPNPDEIANWVERVASDLLAANEDLSHWRMFYDELASLFDSGDSLAGKKIILTQSMELAAAEGKYSGDASSESGSHSRRAVFFSPRVAASDDDDAVETDVGALSPPRSLARRIVFVHQDLEWYEGGERTRGRQFLQTEHLVRPFRVSTLLGFLGRLLRGRTHNAVKRDALYFCYGLFASESTKHAKELAAVGLFVLSSRDEWIPAVKARFGAGWPVDGSRELAALASSAPNADSEFAKMRAMLVAEPSAFGIAEADIGRWSEFLKTLGVNASLPVQETRDSRIMRGVSLIAGILAGDRAPSAVPLQVREQWQKILPTTGNHEHPETEFSTKDPICWFTGQHEIDELPSRLRRDYARLILLTLPTLSAHHVESIWRRERPGGVPSHIESPLVAFLRATPWVPVTIPGISEREFRRSDESWYVGAEDQMAASYSPLVDAPLRGLIEALPANSQVCERFRFLNWANETDASELIDHLTELFLEEDIPDTARDHFRSSLAAGWAAVGNPAGETRPDMNDVLLVERGGQLEALNREELLDQTLYISGRADQSANARLVRELRWPVLLVDSTDPQRLAEVANVLIDAWQEDVKVTSDWDLEVRVDGALWQPSDAATTLIGEFHWLPIFLASVMRFPQTSGIRIGRQLGRVLEQLRTIRLVCAQQLLVVTNSGDQALPARLHGVLPVDSDVPTLLVEGMSSPSTWAQLEYLLRGTLELLGQERFTTEVSLAIRKLADDSTQAVWQPSTAELAEVLQVTEDQINDLASAVSADINGVVSRLSVVTPCLWGDGSLEAITALFTGELSRERVVATLIDLAGNQASADQIFELALAAVDENDLRRKLGISITDFNTCLARLFPAMSPVNNSKDQKQEFDLRVKSRWAELRDVARRARFVRFAAGEVQYDWHAIRDLSFLQPDRAWAATRDELDDELIDKHIDASMRERLGSELLEESLLPAWDEVQQAHGRKLYERLLQTRRYVRAWCEREAVTAPVCWESDQFNQEIRGKLESVGALDFATLTDSDLAEWLDRIGAWPEGMNLTTDQSCHGLSEVELTKQESAEAEAKAAIARAAMQIRFQDRAIDLDDSMSSLVERVTEFLSTDPQTLMSPYRNSEIEVVPKQSTFSQASGGKAGNWSQARGILRLSPAQINAVGLVGEMIAYHWLVGRDPGTVDEACWRSRNVRFVFEGRTGDDGLGFDFEVPRKGGSVMYEVKATIHDAGIIELGETEVRCAQHNSRNDRWRLLVVENALSDHPRVHMLPNPFHHKTRSLFQFVGNSIRLQFHLAN